MSETTKLETSSTFGVLQNTCATKLFCGPRFLAITVDCSLTHHIEKDLTEPYDAHCIGFHYFWITVAKILLSQLVVLKISRVNLANLTYYLAFQELYPLLMPLFYVQWWCRSLSSVWGDRLGRSFPRSRHCQGNCRWVSLTAKAYYQYYLFRLTFAIDIKTAQV